MKYVLANTTFITNTSEVAQLWLCVSGSIPHVWLPKTDASSHSELQRYLATYSYLVGPSVIKFFEVIFNDVVQASSNGAIVRLEQQLDMVNELYVGIVSLDGRMLELSEFEEEKKETKSLIGFIHCVVRGLEDIWCKAAEGHDKLVKAHSNCQLLFQTY